MSIDRLDSMLQMQLLLQTEHMGGDPRDLFESNPQAWAEFMTWNNWALADEMHEAMSEVGWKPWASSRHLNRDAFMKEMVDAWHFFMNLLLAGSPGESPEAIIAEFFELYVNKNAVNAQRQVEGYDGVSSKCPVCHREITEVNGGIHAYEYEQSVYCTPSCASVAHGREAIYG